MPANLEPTKNVEQYYLAAEDDDKDMKREYCFVKQCPCQGECSKASWSKVRASSMLSYEKALSYALQHLTHNKNHEYSMNEAIEIMNAPGAIEWEVKYDTFRDREMHRRACERQEEEAKAAKETKAAKEAKIGGEGGKGGGGQKRKADSCEIESSYEKAEYERLGQMQNKLHAGAIGCLMIGGVRMRLGKSIDNSTSAALASGSVQEMDVNNQDITVKGNQLRHVRCNLVRTEITLKKAKMHLDSRIDSPRLRAEMHNAMGTLREAMFAIQDMIYQDTRTEA